MSSNFSFGCLNIRLHSSNLQLDLLVDIGAEQITEDDDTLDSITVAPSIPPPCDRKAPRFSSCDRFNARDSLCTTDFKRNHANYLEPHYARQIRENLSPQTKIFGYQHIHRLFCQEREQGVGGSKFSWHMGRGHSRKLRRILLSDTILPKH